MEIIARQDLRLNWKKTNTVYAFAQDKKYDIPEDVVNYLLMTYPNGFQPIGIQKVVPKPIVKNIEIKNGLDELIIAQPTIIEDINIDVKDTIERAIEQSILTQKGVWFYYNNDPLVKGIKELKSKLEEDSTLLLEIFNKIK